MQGTHGIYIGANDVTLNRFESQQGLERSVLPVGIVGIDVYAKWVLAKAVTPFRRVDAFIFDIFHELVFEVHHVSENRGSIEVSQVHEGIRVFGKVVIASCFEGESR